MLNQTFDKTHTGADLLRRIEWCCLENGWGETRFGRLFNADPNFVRELRHGRINRNRKKVARRLTAATREKLIRFIEEHTHADRAA